MSFNFDTLTSKQKKVYMAIEAYLRSNKIPPTVREIGEMMGEKTPGAVQGILNRLELKGAIKRQVGAARSIQLVPRGTSIYCNPVYLPEIKKISKRNFDNILDIYNIVKYHPIPPELINPDYSHFIIKCENDNLTENNIFPGDILIIRMGYKLSEDDIALVIYDNHVFLSCYHSIIDDKSKIILKSNNSIIDKEVFYLSEIIIIGKVVVKLSKL
jgi:repressor LexA